MSLCNGGVSGALREQQGAADHRGLVNSDVDRWLRCRNCESLRGRGDRWSSFDDRRPFHLGTGVGLRRSIAGELVQAGRSGTRPRFHCGRLILRLFEFVSDCTEEHLHLFGIEPSSDSCELCGSDALRIHVHETSPSDAAPHCGNSTQSSYSSYRCCGGFSK